VKFEETYLRNFKNKSYLAVHIGSFTHQNGISVDTKNINQVLSNLGSNEDKELKNILFKQNLTFGNKIIFYFNIFFKNKKIDSNSHFVYLNQLFPLRKWDSGDDKKIFLMRIHDLFPLTNPRWFTLKSKIFFYISVKNLQVSKTIYLANSNYTSAQLQKILGVPRENVVVLDCHFQKPKGMPCNKCKGCSFKKRKNYYLMVGTIEPRKNYSDIFRFWISKKSESHPQLVIVGKYGWKNILNLLKLKFAPKNKINYLGYVCNNSLDRLYSHSIGFISNSLDEGFDIPAHTASLYNKELYLSNIEIHREMARKLNNVHIFENLTEINFISQ